MVEQEYRDYCAVDWVAHYADTFPDKTATVELPSGRRRSYSGMHERVARLAAHLADLGVEQGDRVAFLAHNSTDILDLTFATWRLGGIVLALNFRLTAPELSFIIDDAAPRVVLFDSTMSDVVAELREAASVETWLETHGDGGDSEFEQAIATVRSRVWHGIEQPLRAQCMLMYSSGTTGQPKGVIITHGMLLFSAQAGVSPSRSTRDGASLAAMPMFHIAGMNVCCLPSFALGATTVLMRTFKPGDVLRAISDPTLGITSFFAVPAAFNALAQHPEALTTDYSRLVTVFSGAETVPEALVQWWLDRDVAIQEGYGLTETAAQGCALSHEEVRSRPGCAGKPLVHSRMKIMVDESTEAGPDELGEIWIRGAVVTPGYWNRPEATEAAFHGGWFRTGDVGRRDAQGYIYIQDRLKDMYISGGENVYPAEIENLLYELDAISEVAVIGVPDERWGETGCAVVVPKPDRSVDLKMLHAHCQGRLAAFKQPEHLVVVEALPRNATGKVLKHQLRRQIDLGRA